MMKQTAEEILVYMIELLSYYLEELQAVEKIDFFYGEKTAYVECLEIVQQWECAEDIHIGMEYKPR